MDDPPPEGTPKGDVYSFAIIVHEIAARQSVFALDEEGNPKGEYFFIFQILLCYCARSMGKMHLCHA